MIESFNVFDLTIFAHIFFFGGVFRDNYRLVQTVINKRSSWLELYRFQSISWCLGNLTAALLVANGKHYDG